MKKHIDVVIRILSVVGSFILLFGIVDTNIIAINISVGFLTIPIIIYIIELTLQILATIRDLVKKTDKKKH